MRHFRIGEWAAGFVSLPFYIYVPGSYWHLRGQPRGQVWRLEHVLPTWRIRRPWFRILIVRRDRAREAYIASRQPVAEEAGKPPKRGTASDA